MERERTKAPAAVCRGHDCASVKTKWMVFVLGGPTVAETPRPSWFVHRPLTRAEYPVSKSNRRSLGCALSCDGLVLVVQRDFGEYALLVYRTGALLLSLKFTCKSSSTHHSKYTSSFTIPLPSEDLVICSQIDALTRRVVTLTWLELPWVQRPSLYR